MGNANEIWTILKALDYLDHLIEEMRQLVNFRTRRFDGDYDDLQSLKKDLYKELSKLEMEDYLELIQSH